MENPVVIVVAAGRAYLKPFAGDDNAGVRLESADSCEYPSNNDPTSDIG
jgi:hypothetical protein